MKVNPEIMSIRKLPGEVYKHLSAVRKAHEADPNLMLAAVLVLTILLSVMAIPSCHAEVYDVENIANAIAKAENSTKYPYGIKSVKCSGEAQCRNICMNTIENNFDRWQLVGGEGDFIEFLGSRYAPTNSATDDPKNLNRNWIKNVRYYMAKENR